MSEKNYQIGSMHFYYQIDGRLLKGKERERFEKNLLRLLPIVSRLITSYPLCKKATEGVSLQVHFCGDGWMKNLNMLYREKASTTDVLSFPVHEAIREGKGEALPFVELGDIIISIPQATRQAEMFDLTFEQEVWHLMVHGLLHLLGYDHEISQKEQDLMESLEKKWVNKIYNALYR